MSKTEIRKKKPKAGKKDPARRMAAGEFKAKCLSVMGEVNETGRPLVITKRGKPVVKVIPARNGDRKKDAFFGRLKGIMEIVGVLTT